METETVVAASMERRNLRLLLWYGAGTNFRLHVTLSVLLYLHMGLTFTQIGWAWAATNLAWLLTDVLSSRFADRLGYLKVLRWGAVVQTVALGGLAASWNFPSVLAFHFLWGLGWASGRGLNIALAKESADHYAVEEEREELFYWFTHKNAQVFRLAMAAAFVLALVLVALSREAGPRLGYGLQAIFMAAMIGVTAAMREPSEWTQRRQHVQERRRRLRLGGVRQRVPGLWVVIVSGVGLGVVVDMSDLVIMLTLHDQGVADRWYPVLAGLYGLATVPVVWAFGRQVKRKGSEQWAALVLLVRMANIALVVMLLGPGLSGLAGLLPMSVALGATPLVINSQIVAMVPNYKATVMSVVATLTVSLSGALHPLLGWLAEAYSARAAIAVLTVSFGLMSVVVMVALKRIESER